MQSAVDSVAGVLGFGDGDQRPASALGPEASGRLARVAGLWAMAMAVWGGEEEARAFLFRPHPLLEGRPPVDVVLGSDLGARLVENVLGRLRYGSAA